MSARRIDYAQVRTGGHIGPPLRRSGLQRLMAELCRVDVIRVGADLRVRPQGIQRSNEDGRTHRSAPTHYYSSRFDTAGYSFRCRTARRLTDRCGRTNHSPQSKEQSSERLGDTGAYKGGTTSPAGGRTGAVDSSSPTHKGSINQVTSSIRGSFSSDLSRGPSVCVFLLCYWCYSVCWLNLSC